MKNSHKAVRLSLAVLVGAMSPGFFAYEALAGQVTSKAPVRINPVFASPQKSFVPRTGQAFASPNFSLPAALEAVNAAVSISPAPTQAVGPAHDAKELRDQPQLDRIQKVSTDLNGAKPGSAPQDAAQDKIRTDAAWDNAALSKKEAPTLVENSAPSTAPALQAPTADAKISRGAKSSVPALMGIAALPASPVALPPWLTALFAQALPYAKGAGVMLATSVANRVVARMVDELAYRYGWSERTKMIVGFAASAGVWTYGASIGLHAAGIPIIAVKAAFLASIAPYLPTIGFAGKLAGGMAATFVLHKGVTRAIDKVWELLRWTERTKRYAHLASAALVWTSGGAYTIHAAGAPAAAVKTAMGVGESGLIWALKDDISNFIAGVKFLAFHPVTIAETIQIGKTKYAVKDMTLTEVVLLEEGYKSSLTKIKYKELAKETITFFTDYKQNQRLETERPRLSWSGLLSLAKNTSPADLRRAGLSLALAAGLLFLGLPALKASVASSAAAHWIFPLLKGGTIAYATQASARWAAAFVMRLAEKSGWNPQNAVIVKLAAQGLVYLAGGASLLYTAGVSGSNLALGVAVASGAVGFASADEIANLIHSYKRNNFNPDFRIGNIIKIKDALGTVVDMNSRYLVLENPDGSHTLVPQTVVESEKYTAVSPEDLPAAQNKMAPQQIRSYRPTF